MGGHGALRLMQLIDGDGTGPSDAFEASVEVCARDSLEAVSGALSNVDFRNFLPPPSVAAAALIQQYGPFYVFRQGFAYRALADGWSPHEEGKNTQCNIFLPLPPGHDICPDDEGSRQVSVSRASQNLTRFHCDVQVIANHPWQTKVMVVKSGSGYYTSSNSNAGGKFGSKKGGYLLDFTTEGSGACFSVSTSSLGILIRVPLLFGTSN